MLDSYAKVLTKNDIGETGSHQAGIAVPKTNNALLKFFPSLNLNQFNPDTWITCIDPDGIEWEFRYIYYNGKTFSPPKSTRNEYRVTRMTKFFTKWGAKSGDSVVFTKTDNNGCFKISVVCDNDHIRENTNEAYGPIVLRGWSRVY
jgi:hypothetical protein